jgi:hypothetical protein
MTVPTDIRSILTRRAVPRPAGRPGAGGDRLGWSRGFREEPQPPWVFESPEMRFKYGSIGAEHDAGIPYWIFYVLPGLPEKFRQDGEIAPAATRPSAWPGSRARSCRSASPRRPSASPGGQQLRRLPHRQLPRSPDANPVFVVGGPGHTLNIQNFFRL